jgi:hypothetical protein
MSQDREYAAPMEVAASRPQFVEAADRQFRLIHGDPAVIDPPSLLSKARPRREVAMRINGRWSVLLRGL